MLLCLLHGRHLIFGCHASSSLHESAGINWAVTTRPLIRSKPCCSDTQLHTYHQGDVHILAAACHFLDRKSTNAILFAAAAAAATNLF